MGTKTNEYHVPLGNKVARRLMRTIFRGIFHILAKVSISGRENVPRRGSYILVTNHISLYEPPLVLAFWPTPLEALGASDIWEKPGQSQLVRLYGGIRVRRGVVDRQLLKTAIAVIHSGYPLLIMPEGGRSHIPGMRRAARGVAYIAEMTGALIVPAGITGTTDDFFERARRGERPLLAINIGKPFHLSPAQEEGESRHMSLQMNADRVMQRIARLLPPEYRGVYDFTGVERE